MLDFGPVLRREKAIQELAAGLGPSELAGLTEEMCTLQLDAIQGAIDEDFSFVPDDPDANDTFAARSEDVGLSWTLGHVVVHTTASSEESAALALTLARGLAIDGRSRYEAVAESHHDHLIDVETGKVIEFVDEELEALQKRIAEKLGFRLVDHRMELYGVALDRNR